MKQIFVTGISTEVGKTIASSVLTEALEADYWKPIQSGDLNHTDSDKVQGLISNNKTEIHPSAYVLQTPMSPHAAAALDGVQIHLKDIKRPKTANHLIIEGAGGLLVPLNNRDTIQDLIFKTDKVVVVSRHYLGSINHTLLTLQALKLGGFETFLLFSGNPNPTSEEIIVLKSGIPVLGRIPELTQVHKAAISEQAQHILPNLKRYLLR
ncbi:MAG: hypothetical protein RLZZ241_1531 [Bacteroidota bacterium]